MTHWKAQGEGSGLMERECLLFEAGEYADKGVTVTEGDLQAIAANSASEIPVRIEHLASSPFDGALGVVTRLRAVGGQLWGTLRQPIEAWRLAQRAGAKSLSVGLDVAGRRLVETSFVCRPRVANAQVFGWNHRGAEDTERNATGRESAPVRFTTEAIFEEGGQEMMTSVKQLAEGLIGYLRGVTGEEITQTFAAERQELEAERARLREERVGQQVLEWKRQGRLRATEKAETLARTLLLHGDSSVVAFDGKSAVLSAVFAEFLQENGPVIPLGERIPADRHVVLNGGTGARERLMAMAQEKAKAGGMNYVQAFAAVSAAYPEMAMAARED